MDPKEQIQLDDITFDDVIGGDGVATELLGASEDVKDPQETEGVKESEDLQTKVKEEGIEEEGDDDEIDGEISEYEDSQDEDEDEEEGGDEDGADDTIVSSVLAKLGYEVDNQYDDTTEGLVQMTKDIASSMADDRIEEVLEKFPLVKQHLQYVLEGGQSQEFMNAYDPNLDYNRLQINEKDIRSQKAILGDYLTTKGHDTEFIKEMLEDFEDSGKLYQKSESARQALGKYQQAEREQFLVKQQEVQKQKNEDLREFWGGVADTIEESREFAGLQVTERDKNDFFNYLSQPVTREGYTQRDVDHQEADMEVKLAIDYLMYKGFDLETIINTKARSKSVRSLKDRIVKGEESVKSARRASRRSTKFDIDDLDLNI